MTMYKQVDGSGNVTYTDVPTGAGDVQQLDPSGRPRPQADARAEEERKKQELVRRAIKEAKSRAPKIVQYLEYADYLRSTNPWKLQRVLNELKNDKATLHIWLALQKYPQFQPLGRAAFGMRAGEVHLGLVAEAAVGGKAERWMESVLKEMMKRDRWTPDVLGDKATTLPEKKPTYSMSRLGQYMKEDDPRRERALQNAVKARQATEAELRMAKLKGFVRVGNIFVDVGIQLLNPELANEAGYACIGSALNQAYKEDRLKWEQYKHARDLLDGGRADEIRPYLESQGIPRGDNGCPAYRGKR